MFKAAIKADKLKDALGVIRTITNEAIFKVTESGITVNAVDPATVAMIRFELNKDAFSLFEVTDCEIGVDIPKLHDKIEMAGKEKDIELELDEVSHKLSIQMHGLTYTISLLNPSSIQKEPKVPSLELPVKVEIKGEDLKRAVKAAEKVADYMFVGTEAGCLLMSAEGDTDSVQLLMGKEQCISMNPGVQGDIRSLFSLDYLSDIAKVASSASSVALELGKDFPILIKFKIADGHGNVTFMIAPRVEEE